MTPTDRDMAHRLPGPPATRLRRVLRCIRLDEVAVLQGAPLLGAMFATPALGPSNALSLASAAALTVALLVLGNLCLVAHVFVLNDWAGFEGDARDLNRAARTFAASGVSRGDVAVLAAVLLLLALVLFSAIGLAVLGLALAIATLSALYSVPGVHGKGRPLVSSALHLAGGTLHFLLGYAALAPVSAHAIAIGCYFGIVFAAGHLTHEARDHDGDLATGIRTNAVTFGQRRVLLASMALFTVAYALLTVLALSGAVARVLAACALMYPLHLWAAWRAMRSGAEFASLRRLQHHYRLIHAVIGLAMLATVPRWGP